MAIGRSILRLNDMLKISNLISFRTRGLSLMKNSLLGLMLVTIYFATYAQSTCGFLDTKVTLSDRTSLCVKDVPFFNKAGLIVNDSNSTYADIAKRSSTFSIATTTEPQLCPFASQISWNFGTRENSLSALKGCEEKLQSRVSQIGKADQSVNCKCDILIDSNSASKWNKRELDLLTQQYLTQISASNKPLAIIASDKKNADIVIAEEKKKEEEEKRRKEIEQRVPNPRPPIASPNSFTSKVALVIGNSNYPNQWKLKNPINDSRAMQSKLTSLGFNVIYREDLKTAQIGSLLDEVSKKVTPGSAFVFYYAGHGVQIRNENFLPTVDASIASQFDIPTQSISLNRILDLIGDTKSTLNLLMLDACRNNPWVSTAVSSRSMTMGLAKVEPPRGTLISYATRPGGVADDGNSSNGLYTQFLLKHIDTADLPVENFFKRVANDVIDASSGKQEPWVEGGIRGEFTFKAK